MRKLVIYSVFAAGALVFAYFMQPQKKIEVNIYDGEFILCKLPTKSFYRAFIYIYLLTERQTIFSISFH